MKLPDYVSRMPEPHRGFLKRAVERLGEDRRIVGLAIGGSFLREAVDEYSDLDFVVVVEPDAFPAVMPVRTDIAKRLGSLLAAFTGEHVREPRLLICLYGPPLLHVDLKFVSLDDAADRVEDPAVLWERDGRLSAVLARGAAEYPAPDLQWIEDRFWVWVHYGAVKIGRGELFEACGFLAVLRMQVLGPLGLMLHGAQPAGVRRVESVAPQFSADLERTLADYDPLSCAQALLAAADLYRSLRDRQAGAELRRNHEAETASLAYLAEIRRRCEAQAPRPGG